jgi:U3 small nucleolar RNA-associated protein 20
MAILLLTSFQDVLAGGPKDAVEALFRPASSENEAATFGAACTLATALDIVAWNHYSQVLAPLILASTSRYIGEASETKQGSQSAFQGASPDVNALSLLARLAYSGRLRLIVDTASPPVKAWERVVGDKCKSIIEDWTTRYKEGDVPSEDEVSVTSAVKFYSA